VEKLVEQCIPRFPTEGKSGKLAEDQDIQVHEKAIQELGLDNPIDQPGLIVK
jgi:hypothetical protein